MNLDFSKSAWLKQEFEMGGREWKINKLPALVAKDVLVDHIRPCFASVEGLDLRDDRNIAVLFGRIPAAHLKALSKIFAKDCIKTRNDAGQWVPFATDPERFAQGIDPVSLLTLDFRCIAINFGESVSAFVKDMVELAGADVSQLQTALTQSSTSE